LSHISPEALLFDPIGKSKTRNHHQSFKTDQKHSILQASCTNTTTLSDRARYPLVPNISQEKHQRTFDHSKCSVTPFPLPPSPNFADTQSRPQNPTMHPIASVIPTARMHPPAPLLDPTLTRTLSSNDASFQLFILSLTCYTSSMQWICAEHTPPRPCHEAGFNHVAKQATMYRPKNIRCSCRSLNKKVEPHKPEKRACLCVPLDSAITLHWVFFFWPVGCSWTHSGYVLCMQVRHSPCAAYALFAPTSMARVQLWHLGRWVRQWAPRRG
jgi:hypothetical protein